MLGSRLPHAATLAVYRGHRMAIEPYPTLDDAIAAADAAVQQSADCLAVVRDDLNIMRYAADSTGRTWRDHGGRHAAEVAAWGYVTA